MHATKFGDLPLFATVGALAAVWLMAVVGLSLTMKREYLRTFVSLQTGYADSQSYFLDNQANDPRRVLIFFCNEQHWQAIRDRVRQWVLSVYATWQAADSGFLHGRPAGADPGRLHARASRARPQRTVPRRAAADAAEHGLGAAHVACLFRRRRIPHG